jgi:putative salt-induced outer membrane protein
MLQPFARGSFAALWRLGGIIRAFKARSDNQKMKKSIITIALAGAFFAANEFIAFGQTNRVAPPPQYPWEGSVSLGLTLTRGNSDTTLFAVKALTDRKGNVNELSFGADAAYGANNGVENAESLHGFAQWDRLFSDKFFGYVRAEGLHDGIADVKYRSMVGPGAGYYFLKETNTTLAAEAGGSVVFERLGTNDSTYATLRLAERFEHKFDGHGARVWQTVEILPQVDDFNNYIVNAEVGVEASISKSLSLQTYLDDSYANEPAAGRLKNDLKLVSGISYKF